MCVGVKVLHVIHDSVLCGSCGFMIGTINNDYSGWIFFNYNNKSIIQRDRHTVLKLFKDGLLGINFVI